MSSNKQHGEKHSNGGQQAGKTSGKAADKGSTAAKAPQTKQDDKVPSGKKNH
jgi:hypothetical protein